MSSENRPSGKGGKVGVAIAIGIAIAAALGIFVQRQMRPSALAPVEPTSTTPDASNAPNVPSAAEPAAVAKVLPETLPQFELKDRAGKVRKLGDWKGQPLVVNYWATWCPPCVREIPLLNSFRKQRARQRVEVIGIAVDFRDDVLKFAAATKLEYPLLIGEEDGLAAVNAVGMQAAFPFTLFADSQQRIIAVKVGELHQEELDLILDRVIDIDAGKMDLAAARAQISEGLKEISTKRALAEAATPKSPPPTT
jgi:peroxiredoxin